MTATLLAALLLAGCAREVPPLEPPGTAAAGPVFVVHGIWPDQTDLWQDVVEALRARGIEAVPVPYNTFVIGYLFDFGTDGPAWRLARFERRLRARHAWTACSAPLRLWGIGFSAGTVVLQKAAAHGATFEGLYFGGSPIPPWSDALEAALAEGRVGRLVNYFSPADPIAVLVLGSGVFGFHGGDDDLEARVDNRPAFNLHWPEFWEDDVRAQVVDEIEDASCGPPHTCFGESGFRRWYLEAREELLAGD